jgi:hypothetical protein
MFGASGAILYQGLHFLYRSLLSYLSLSFTTARSYTNCVLNLKWLPLGKIIGTGSMAIFSVFQY